LRNELAACIDDLFIAVEVRKYKGQRSFNSNILLLSKPGYVNTPRVIEGENRERCVNHGSSLPAEVRCGAHQGRAQ